METRATVRVRDGVTIIDLAGNFTFGTCEELLWPRVCELLEERPDPQSILVNLAEVPYMDSSGISELVRCFNHARKSGSAVKLVNPKKRVYDVLQIVKLHDIFEVFKDEDEAVRSCDDA